LFARFSKFLYCFKLDINDVDAGPEAFKYIYRNEVEPWTVEDIEQNVTCILLSGRFQFTIPFAAKSAGRV